MPLTSLLAFAFVLAQSPAAPSTPTTKEPETGRISCATVEGIRAFASSSTLVLRAIRPAAPDKNKAIADRVQIAMRLRDTDLALTSLSGLGDSKSWAIVAPQDAAKCRASVVHYDELADLALLRISAAPPAATDGAPGEAAAARDGEASFAEPATETGGGSAGTAAHETQSESKDGPRPSSSRDGFGFVNGGEPVLPLWVVGLDADGRSASAWPLTACLSGPWRIDEHNVAHEIPTTTPFDQSVWLVQPHKLGAHLNGSFVVDANGDLVARRTWTRPREGSIAQFQHATTLREAAASVASVNKGLGPKQLAAASSSSSVRSRMLPRLERDAPRQFGLRDDFLDFDCREPNCRGLGQAKLRRVDPVPVGRGRVEQRVTFENLGPCKACNASGLVPNHKIVDTLNDLATKICGLKRDAGLTKVLEQLEATIAQSASVRKAKPKESDWPFAIPSRQSRLVQVIREESPRSFSSSVRGEPVVLLLDARRWNGAAASSHPSEKLVYSTDDAYGKLLFVDPQDSGVGAAGAVLVFAIDAGTVYEDGALWRVLERPVGVPIAQ